MSKGMFRGRFFPHEIDKRGYKKGVEVGVYRGEFSECLLEHSKLDTLYSVDIWVDMAGNPMDAFFKESMDRLSKYGTRSMVIKAGSVETSKRFEDGSLDFIYIDADHCYEGVMGDLVAWYPKIRNGGMMSGHDYHNTSYNGQPLGEGHAKKGETRVYDAVNDFVRMQPRHVVGKTRCKCPSWWFVKE